METKYVFVLENDPARISAMQEVLTNFLPRVSATYINNAPEAIEYLRQHLAQVAAISLDHDLGPEEDRGGVQFDPGSGRDVAAYLGSLAPSCPVIIHTDNFFVRPTMQKMLDRGGWHHSFVAPGNGTGWVAQSWLPLLKSLLQ